MSRFVLLAGMAAWAMVGTGALWAGANVWTSLGPASGPVTPIAIEPQNSGTVYAATGAGLFKSADSGASWSAVKSGLENYPFSALAIDPQNPDTIYAAGYDTALYKTTNGGARWTVVGYGLLFGYGRQADSVIAVAIDPRDSNIVYAGTSAGAFKSTDLGISWSAVKSRLITDANGPLVISALAIDPQNPDTVYATGTYTGMFKTTDA